MYTPVGLLSWKYYIAVGKREIAAVWIVYFNRKDLPAENNVDNDECWWWLWWLKKSILMYSPIHPPEDPKHVINRSMRSYAMFEHVRWFMMVD